MKKLIFMLTAVIFIFTACQKEEGSADPVTATSESGFHKSDCQIVTKMIAGGGKYDENCTGIEVGTITVNEVGDNIIVTYEITMAGWAIDATHLYVGPEDDIPHGKKGNIKNGHFPDKSTHDPGVTTKTFNIPTPDGAYVIAAHADVSYYDGLTDFCETLPETVDVVLVYPGINTNSLFDITINGGPLDGMYAGWCIDVANPSVNVDQYEVFCSYEDLPDGLSIDHPENLPIINWIINQGFVGEPSSTFGDFTFADVQAAIWNFIDDEQWTGPGFEPNADRVQEIIELVDAAGAEATNFEPPYGGFIAVVLVPETAEKQVLIAAMAFMPGEYGDETAWGYGYKNGYCNTYCDNDCADGISFTDSQYYGAKKWGWYFYGCE